MIHAKLGIAAENSGQLVSLVRREARKKAEELNVKWHNNGDDKRIIIINEDDLIKMMEITQ